MTENRIIKFRVWDADFESMDYDTKCNQLPLNAVLMDVQKNGILMQFTGAHDINGKEIYEGDIVEWKMPIEDAIRNDPIRGLVIWDREECKFVVVQLTKGKHVYEIDGREYDTEFYYPEEAIFNWNELQVIGNEYENADLLSEKDQNNSQKE